MTDQLADRIGVRELIERYSMCLNVRDFAGMRGLFVEQACWRVDAPFNLRLEGDAIVAGIAEMAGAMPFLFQAVLGTAIDIVGDEASARTSVHELGQRHAGEGGLDSWGLYHDRVVRTPAGWRFAERRFQPLFLDTAARRGDVVGRPAPSGDA